DAEDNEALDHHDPGGFDELGVGDGDHWAAGIFSIWTETRLPLSRELALPSATPSMRKQVPFGTRSLIETLARTLVPFRETETSSLVVSPRRSAPPSDRASCC